MNHKEKPIESAFVCKRGCMCEFLISCILMCMCMRVFECVFLRKWKEEESSACALCVCERKMGRRETVCVSDCMFVRVFNAS